MKPSVFALWLAAFFLLLCLLVLLTRTTSPFAAGRSIAFFSAFADIERPPAP